MRLAGLIAALLLLRLTAYAVVAGGFAALPDQLCQWDCTWYMHTATAGYDLVPLTAPPHDYGQANWPSSPSTRSPSASSPPRCLSPSGSPA